MPAHKPISVAPACETQRTPDDPALLAAVVHGVPQPVFVVDACAPYAVRWHNDAAAQMTALTDHKTVLVTDGSVLAHAIATAGKTGQTVTLHEHAVLGVACYTITVSQLSLSPDSCLIVAVPENSVSADNRNTARDHLRSAGTMARMLAHEIKNPLAGIQAAGQLLAKKVQDAVGNDLAQLIVKETARIGRLIDRMAVFDADGTPTQTFVPVNVHAPLEHALASTAAAFPHVDIIRRFDPSLPDIAGDHDQLVQVFDNICRNAAEAGARTITIRSFYNHVSAPVDSAHQRRLPVTIAIEDDGDGMDEQTQMRLFEPYYTTKAQGQGLGLPIVAKLVDDHAGLIMVARDNAKTIFTLAFPHDRDDAINGDTG